MQTIAHSFDNTCDPNFGWGERGVSFVEVMVTIFIMALATSFIIFTIPRSGVEPQDAVRLKSLLERASDRARMIGTPTGLMILDDSYEISDWRGGAWQRVEGTHTAFDSRMQIVVAPGRRQKDDRPDDWPVIVFDPLGHTPPLDLNVIVGRQTHRLTIGPGGKVQLETPDA